MSMIIANDYCRMDIIIYTNEVDDSFNQSMPCLLSSAEQLNYFSGIDLELNIIEMTLTTDKNLGSHLNIMGISGIREEGN
jgi:hypothetical protein